MFKKAYSNKQYSTLSPILQVVHKVNISAIFVNFLKEI
jgi:hypothetical protein